MHALQSTGGWPVPVAVVTLAIPAALMLVLVVSAAIERGLTETALRRLFGPLVTVVVAGAAALFVGRVLDADAGAWTLAIGGRVLYAVDGAAAALLLLASLIVAVVGNFSLIYLHRERGVRRYFLAYAMFFTGITQLIAAADFLAFVAGWELVGISSVMLIAFFEERPAPVANAGLAFATYRLGDIGLLCAAAVMHDQLGTSALPWHDGVELAAAGALPLALVAVGLGVSAMAKAAQLPFSAWLPRAMEGPTPSSAVFYGALSVHAGAYLLWRIEPLLAQVPGAAATVVLVGAATAAYGAFCGRIRPDVKTQLAYASMAQLGLIFVEIGCGWRDLALWHILGHMCVRTLQLLSAPSVLHTFRALRLERASARGSFHVEALLPAQARAWLYRSGLTGARLADVTSWLVARPVASIGSSLVDFDRRLLQQLRFRLEARPGVPASESPELAVVPQGQELRDLYQGGEP